LLTNIFIMNSTILFYFTNKPVTKIRYYVSLKKYDMWPLGWLSIVDKTTSYCIFLFYFYLKKLFADYGWIGKWYFEIFWKSGFRLKKLINMSVCFMSCSCSDNMKVSLKNFKLRSKFFSDFILDCYEMSEWVSNMGFFTTWNISLLISFAIYKLLH
jgi:hypothetical protein